MELIKPEPLVIGGHAHYTLSSYDPVQIEVQVHDITDDDVEQALRAAITQAGGGPERLNDDAWIREQFASENVRSTAELRALLREEIEDANDDMVERQAASTCADALAERLEQRVAAEDVARVRKDIEETFAVTMEQQGIPVDMFLAQMGGKAQMDAMFDEQARQTAAQEAAIDAWASKYNLTVDDDEMLMFLGMPPEQGKKMLDSLRAAGKLDSVRNMALRSKALSAIMDESTITYVHDGANTDDHPHLKLV